MQGRTAWTHHPWPALSRAAHHDLCSIMRVMSDLEYSHVVARQERQEINFLLVVSQTKPEKGSWGWGEITLSLERKQLA